MKSPIIQKCVVVFAPILLLAIGGPVGQAQTPVASGRVFHDANQNHKFDDGETALPDIKVSNGLDIVKTNEQGQYQIPLPDESVLFVIKPRGYRTALNEQNLPRFFYIHKPNGSPQLQYPGSKPTGPLPQSIDFPLFKQDEPKEFRVILFGDPQPRNHTEVDYIAHDIVSELIDDRDHAFGVTLGDIAFDNLDTFETFNQAVSLIGIPWYNIIGNHDINFDTTQRKYINETYERVYGPSYYSFDYGPVHFIALDNIDWVRDQTDNSKFHYAGGFGKQQLEFVKKDLSEIPTDQMVVLLMHIPIVGVSDREALYRLIEDRLLCVSISAHTHMHQHLFLGPEDGFQGKKRHHHIINVTVSGSWWSGGKGDRGIPHATMQDGAPNGYSIMTFTKEEYKLDFKAAGRSSKEQMSIQLPHKIKTDPLSRSDVWVNVYNGSSKSNVEMSLNESDEWKSLKRKDAFDSNYKWLMKYESQLFSPENDGRTMKNPKISSHLWHAKLSENLKPGTHLLRVRTTDMHGRTYHSQRSFRVVD